MDTYENEDRYDDDLEWEQRTLCRDESCIGVIGPDGRCKECGLRYEGTLAAEGPSEDPGTDRAETAEPKEDVANLGPEWESRTLCSDGACIGIIGPDGCCKECGLPYSGPAEES